MTPKWPWALHGGAPYTCICVTSIPESQISAHFLHRMTQKDLQRYKINSTALCVICVTASQISVTECTNSKVHMWTLQGKRHTIYELLVFTSPKFQFVYFLIFLWPAVFELHAILRNAYRMNLKWSWTLLRSNIYSIYVLLVSVSPKFHSGLLSMTSLFEIQSCWKSEKSGSARMNSEWPWKFNRQRYPVYTNYVPPRPTFWSVLLHGQPFSKHKVFEIAKIRNAQNDLRLTYGIIWRSNVPCIYKVLPHKPQICFVSLYNQPFQGIV